MDCLQARLIYLEGEWELAREGYGQAIEIAPMCNPRPSDANLATLYLNRARAAAKLGLNTRVVADCSDALALREGYTAALQERASAYVKLFGLKDAISDLIEAGAEVAVGSE